CSRSARFNPAAWTRTRISPAPGFGWDTSRTSRTSGPPGRVMTTAFMLAFLFYVPSAAGNPPRDVRCPRASLLQILHQHHLILGFVVNHFIYAGTREHDAETTGANVLLLTHQCVTQGILRWISDRGVRQSLKLETRARIGNAIQQ